MCDDHFSYITLVNQQKSASDITQEDILLLLF